jgi:glycosyltransferase involved in cell wall biosynthesis
MTRLSRWLIPIATPVPRVDVVHAISAGLPSLPALAAKMEHSIPFMLSEHGIYLRERYLFEAEEANSLFVKLFSLRFARRITEVSYAFADQISPVCNYNQRWELRGGAAPERLRTIYNGVDPEIFTPAPRADDARPVVAWVGRITPVKDVVTLIEAAALVHKARPDIEFRLYGTVPPGDETYYQRCVTLRAELGIENVVTFSGFAPSPEIAFNDADVVVLSSISEALPYSVLEAMLCAKPVVATAVGGVAEALEGCGVTVEPRHPEPMAQAILELMNDPSRRATLGRKARDKAKRDFNLRESAATYDLSYRRLAGGDGALPVTLRDVASERVDAFERYEAAHAHLAQAGPARSKMTSGWANGFPATRSSA